MTIEFDPTTHVYIVDGKKLPSVTQIVAPLGPDYDEPDDLTEGVIDAASERGTVMHDYLAFRLTGGEPEDYELPAMYAPYADAVELFLAEHHITPLLIETPVAMPDVAAGTPDLVCDFDGVPALLDYKFVSQVSKSKVGAQLAGYADILAYGDVYVDNLYAVQFLRDGTYRLYPVDEDGGTQAWSVALAVWRLRTAKHPRGRIFGGGANVG